MIEDPMAPDSRAPKKVEVKLNLSPELLKQAERIAERQGKPIAELHRQIWEAGLIAVASGDTALMINERTSRSLETGQMED